MPRELSSMEGRKWQYIMQLVSAMGDRWMRFGMAMADDNARKRTFALQREELSLRRDTAKNSMKLEELRLASQGKRTEAEFALKMNELGMRKEEFIFQKERDIKAWDENLRRWNAENEQRMQGLRLQREQSARASEDHFLKMQEGYRDSIQRVGMLAATEKQRVGVVLDSMIGDPVIGDDGVPLLNADGSVQRELKKWIRDGLAGERRGTDVKDFRDSLRKIYGKDVELKDVSGFEAVRAALDQSLRGLAQSGGNATWTAVLNRLPGGSDFIEKSKDLESFKRAQNYWDRGPSEDGSFVQDYAENYGTVSSKLENLVQSQLAIESNLSLARGEILKMQNLPNRGDVGWLDNFQAVMKPISAATNNFSSSINDVYKDLSKMEEEGELPPGDPEPGRGAEEGPVLRTSAQAAVTKVERARDRALAATEDPQVQEQINLHYGAQIKAISSRGEMTGAKNYAEKVSELMIARQAQRAMHRGSDKLSKSDIGDILQAAGPVPGGLRQSDEDLGQITGMLGDERFGEALLSKRDIFLSQEESRGRVQGRNPRIPPGRNVPLR